MMRRLLLLALLIVGACKTKHAPPATEEHTHIVDAARKRVPPEVLKILADPADKGDLTDTIDANGDEWLVNPRNGYRYPVHDGVPVMLVEEGAKHRVPNAPQPR